MGRDAPRRCVAGSSARGKAPKEGSGASVPGTSPFFSSDIHFFRRTRPLSRTRSVHTRPAVPGPGMPPSRRPFCPPRERRPSQRNAPRLAPRRVIPSWSSPRASSRRSAAGTPEGKESLRYDRRYPVARPPHRHESFIRWRAVRCRLARFPRRLVRPLSEDATGRRPVESQGIPGQVDQHRSIQGDRRPLRRPGGPDLHRRGPVGP